MRGRVGLVQVWWRFDMTDAGGAALDRRRLRVCLAASGGGHLRQLLDLEPAWAAHDVFFVSEPSALSRSLAQRLPVEFVQHVALGQGRLGRPMEMVGAAVANLTASFDLIRRRRPDVVVTTGAGSVFFTTLFARLFGARILIIESLARFTHMSAFGRLAGPLAHEKVLQSRALSAHWPGAPVFDPVRRLEGRRPAKEALLLVTVGATLPFDPMVAEVFALARDGKIPERLVVQTGEGGLTDAAYECHETLPFDDLLKLLEKADIVVCHGGTGSLITALRAGCRVVAVPRRFESGDHYDDHQMEIATAFAERGLIEVAGSPADIGPAIERVRSREAVLATSDPEELREHLFGLMAKWAAAPRRRWGALA